MPSFTARRHGKLSCGHTVEPGDEIFFVKHEHGWYCEGCAYERNIEPSITSVHTTNQQAILPAKPGNDTTSNVVPDAPATSTSNVTSPTSTYVADVVRTCPFVDVCPFYKGGKQ